MHFTALALGAAVLEGVVAQPAHRHAAAHHHKKRVDFSNPELYKDVDWSKVDFGFGSSSPAAAPAAPAAPQVEAHYAAAPSAEPSSTGESSDAGSNPQPSGSSGGDDHSPSTDSCSNLDDVYTDGDSSSSGPTAAHHKRALLKQDLYVGNTGGSSYASNFAPIKDCNADSATYSITFVNNMGSEQKFWLWNKIGADGQMNGMMKNAYYQFKLANGQRAAFSVQPNTQTAFSLACGRAPTNGNVPNCNIGEANFNDQSPYGSVGGSFYDVSMVTLNDINSHGGHAQNVPMKISAPGYSDSTNTNCVYKVGTDNSPQDPGADGKCACGPNDASPFHITATFG